MVAVAVLALLAFATGITLCIDWTGASTPPRDYGQPAMIAPHWLP